MVLNVLNRAGQGVTAGTYTPPLETGDTGWEFPATAQSVSSMSGFGSGASAWVGDGVTSVTANDGSETWIGGSNTRQSEVLYAHDFPFGDIPNDATVTGVAARFERRRSDLDGGSPNAHTLEFNLVLPGPTGVGNKSNTPNWSLSSVVESYGADGDLWGQGSIAVADVKDNGFGFGLRIETTDALGRVDYIQMRVWHETQPPDVDVFYLDGAAKDDLRTLASAGAVDGEEYPYRVDEDGVGWEIGKGVYRDNGGNPYIERSTPLLSSEVDDSKVTFGSGATLIVDLVGGQINLQEIFGVN